MVFGELIKYLEAVPPDTEVPLGFHAPHSCRGYYEQLAFEPKRNTTVGEMLASAREAMDATYTGWKGGEFRMDKYTDVWLAEQGCTGEMIGPILLAYMCGIIEEEN